MFKGYRKIRGICCIRHLLKNLFIFNGLSQYFTILKIKLWLVKSGSFCSQHGLPLLLLFFIRRRSVLPTINTTSLLSASDKWVSCLWINWKWYIYIFVNKPYTVLNTIQDPFFVTRSLCVWEREGISDCIFSWDVPFLCPQLL